MKSGAMLRRRTAPFAIALGGGGARGLAHVGVLLELERDGLRPRGVAGTSIGAVVGALYAAGIAADDLAESLDLLDIKGLAGVTKFSLRPGSVLSADAFEERMREVLPATFDELETPFAAVAADLLTGQRVVLKEGDLPRAVRASMSIPIVFEPVRIGDWLLVDGGIVDPVPVDAAHGLAGDPVVAVDVGPLRLPGSDATGPRGGKPVLRPEGPTTVQIGTRAFDIAEHWLARAGLAGASVVIAPELGDYLMTDFLEGASMIERGGAEAAKCLPMVREALEDAARTPLGRWWRARTSQGSG